MSSTPAQRAFSECGQSIWYDNIRRSQLRSGEFAELIDAGVRGCTSNPTIFDKAITGSEDYDGELQRLVRRGADRDEIYHELVLADIRDAADALSPLHERSDGLDGFISLEVHPDLASNTERTVAEAKKLARLVDRPNLMIKVPATDEGLPAVTELIASGISVNVTLIFSVEQYQRVARAYMDGLSVAVQRGHDLATIASVASFFVSRVDTAVDRLLEAKLSEASVDDARRLEALLGRAAIANAKRAYSVFQQLFAGAAFEGLGARGARPQRVLWASTGTKNPKYSDTLYVDELMGPHTVNTVPPATLAAFQDHGRVDASLERDLDGAPIAGRRGHRHGPGLRQPLGGRSSGVSRFDGKLARGHRDATGTIPRRGVTRS